MNLSRLFSLFRKAPDVAAPPVNQDDTFAARYHRYKLILNAWGKLQELMTEMELAICCQHPFGMQTVRALCTRVTTQVYQCMRQLEELAPGRYPDLEERFAAIQSTVSTIVYGRSTVQDGPAVLPLGHDDLTHDDLGDPTMTRLGQLKALLGRAVPEGFIITASACQRTMHHNGLQEEVSRRVQASGGIRPDNIGTLSASVRALIEASTPPDEVTASILQGVAALRATMQGRNMQLLFRGRVWPQGTADDTGGMTLWGPAISLHDADNETILAAFRATLALKYSPQGTAYRRNRGLRDAGTCVCIGCFVVEAPVAGGVAYTGNPLQARDTSIHVYAGHGLPESVEDGAEAVDAYHVARGPKRSIRLRSLADPATPVLTDEAARAVVSLALSVEEHFGCQQEIDWILEPDGTVLLLNTRPLPLAPYLDAEERPGVEACPPGILACGGITASPGVTAGPVHVVRTEEDARTFPDGGVLVVDQPLAQWGMLMDRAVAVVAEHGHVACQLAATAREFGKPALLGVEGAMLALAGEAMVTVCGDIGVVYPERVEDMLEHAPPPRNFMPGSPVLQALEAAAHHILPLTLDPDGPDFKARNCHTFHDIGRFCHEQTVSEMFSFGSQQKYAQDRVKQLKCDVVKQFWVVNLDDGFTGPVKGPVVHTSQIASLPMQVLWQGMNAYPWEGPPRVDAKGFMSVLFEATANPHLDPAAQSAFFTEKNYFMVSRNYVSLHSRFGFHFVAVEALMSARTQENYIVFQLRGGAANIERRILRVRFVAELLQEFGFIPSIRRDALSARLEGVDMADMERHLLVAGHLTIHTRQLDMVMADSTQVAEKRESILAHCRELLSRPVTLSSSSG